MNESYSKTELLHTAVRKILVDDNANTGKEVREIQFYVVDRITRDNLNESLGFPQITLSVDEGDSPANLPSNNFMFLVKIHNDTKNSYANTTLDRISARVEFLLNKKVNEINNAVTGKNLRCRLFHKMSAITDTDYIMNIITKTMMFNVIADDEVLS